MRAFGYSENDLNFLIELLFYDVKLSEIRRRNGQEFGDKVWYKLTDGLVKEFGLKDSERWLVLKGVAKMYEEDPELVNPRDRYDRRGLPFD